MEGKERPEIGRLALKYANLEKPLQVLPSAAGWYIGTWDVNDGPVSRESVEYFPTEEEAKEALKSSTWTQRNHP